MCQQRSFPPPPREGGKLPLPILFVEEAGEGLG
jgi:hypothetical protein